MSAPLIHASLALALAVGLAAQDPAAADARSVKVYDLGVRPPGPDLVLRGPVDTPTPDVPESGSAMAAVAQMVRAFAQPPLAVNEDVRPLGERWIVLLGRAEQHAWLERYLAAARRQREQTIALQCELLQMPEIFYVEKVAPALARPGKATGAPVILAPGPGTDAFRQALSAEEHCLSLSAPRMEVRPLEAASMSLLNNVMYVRDFEVEVAKESFVAKPVIDVVHDGVTIAATAAMLQEGVAGVSLQVAVADLKKPISEFTTNLAGSTLPVKIQLPQLLTTQARAAVELPRGHTVVLVMPPMAGKRHVLLVKLE